MLAFVSDLAPELTKNQLHGKIHHHTKHPILKEHVITKEAKPSEESTKQISGRRRAANRLWSPKRWCKEKAWNLGSISQKNTQGGGWQKKKKGEGKNTDFDSSPTTAQTELSPSNVYADKT